MNVLEKIGEKITDVATTIAFRHIGYLIQYGENIQHLKDETKKLKDEWKRIDGMVNQAKANAQIVEDDVLSWLTSAHKMIMEVETFLEDIARENMRCFKWWCPNIRWRYRLGKESILKKDLVTSLEMAGTKLMALPVAHPAPPPEFGFTFFSADHEPFDSRKQVFKSIMESLRDPGVKIIGIYGPGGVGKTTMAVEVGKMAKRDGLFDDVAIATVSHKLDKKKVQGQLAADLGLNLGEDEKLRAGQLLNRLNNGKKNLVILDDAWKKVNLAEIGIPVTDGNKGCKVLVTSRMKDLCTQIMPLVDPKGFAIEVLSKSEAWILFTKAARISDNSEMASEAKELCDKCGGLPIAIRAVATALEGKGKYAWKDALRKMRSSKTKDIVGIERDLFISLRLSYDLLESNDAQSCFLLCSFFPEDAEIPIDDLTRYNIGMRLLDQNLTVEEIRDRLLTVVEVLRKSCLLLEGKHENVVKMHDVIREVAISIAEDEKGYLVKHDLTKWPQRSIYEHYSAISLKSEYFHEIPSELECKELHTLVLRSSGDLSLPDSFFNGMENNLEVLDLSGMYNIKRLPSSLAQLIKLRMLFLNQVSLTEIALSGLSKSLEILRLDGIEELAPEIRQLTHLRLLDLENCTRLRAIQPNILSNLIRLEELCIPDHFDRWEGEPIGAIRNACLVELNSLTHLTTLKVRIPKASLSHIGNCFEKLVRFKISIGERLEWEKVHASTRILKLSDAPLEDKFKVLLENAEVLHLNKLNGLKEVLHDNDGWVFFELKYLTVTCCDDVEHLLGRPEHFLPSPPINSSRSFCKLTELKVTNCRLKRLFSVSIARRLSQLQRLTINRCDYMEEIVGSRRQGDEEEVIFPRLERLNMWFLPNLRSFSACERNTSPTEASSSDPAQPLFNEEVGFPALEELIISDLNNISDVWDRQLKPPVTEAKESFSQLRLLRVSNCDKLVDVIPSNMLPRLQNLEELNVWGCDSVAAVLPRLESLCLGSLGNLKETGLKKKEGSYHGINVVYPNIRRVVIWTCRNLEYLFSASTARNLLVHLEVLDIQRCSKLKAIVETTADREGANDNPFIFPKLVNLDLRSNPNLMSFCSSCGPEGSLFNEKVVFPCLEIFEFWNISYMQAIWNRTPPTNSFNKITHLSVYWCNSLLYVAPSELLGSLQNLQTVEVRGCYHLEEVFKTTGLDTGEGVELIPEPTSEEIDINVALPRLKEVELVDLPRLISFCSGSKFPSSVKWKITNCPSWRPSANPGIDM